MKTVKPKLSNGELPIDGTWEITIGNIRATKAVVKDGVMKVDMPVGAITEFRKLKLLDNNRYSATLVESDLLSNTKENVELYINEDNVLIMDESKTSVFSRRFVPVKATVKKLVNLLLYNRYHDVESVSIDE